MKRFLKSFSLLLCSCLFAATGWAAGESISIGFNHTRTDDNSKFTGETLYGWTGAQVAGDNWNHIEPGHQNPLSDVSVTGLKLNSGEKVTATIKNLSTQGSWMHYGPAQLNGGTRDYYDGQITFTLEDIPFSEYTVVLFMATNDGNKTWGAVKVTSDAEDEGKYYTYVDGVLSAEGTAESTWGNSSSLTENYTATEGTNVMVIPNLSGDKTFLTHGTSGDSVATRGGLYAIQIINTGVLTIPEPMWTWDGTKADGSMCTQLDRLPFGTSYTVNNRIFDLNDLNIPAKNFTYSFWTMREGAADWKNYAGFSNASGVLQVQRDRSGSTVHIYMAGGPSLASGEMSFPLANNTYELVTCVQDSASFKIYVNGELKATETLNNWSSLSDASATMRWFALGSAPNVSGSSFEDRNSDARVADARIYGAALSAEQVQILYKASIANMPEVVQNATAHYEFEGTAYGLRGNLSLTSEAPSASDCVETLRKYPEGVASAGEFHKGMKIRSGVSPHNNYQWADNFTVAAYVNLTDCPDNGTICSFRDSYWLQKVSATEIRFGKNNDEESVKASLADLSLGYHLVVVTKTADTITIQIDNNEPESKSVALNSPDGIQLGTGWASSAARATGMILDGFTLWEKVLSSEEVAELTTYYPELYPALSMAADTGASGALSWDEITTVVGTRTTWDISGEVVISLDADVDPALTALTLLPANASGDSLTITGTGSLYGGNFTLTTAIPVDITNRKVNPTITLSGSGDVTIRKPATGSSGGIAPAFNNYTGTLTVDDGQQITRMGGDLTIPFTVGENGAKLHSNDGNWTVSSKISGSGTLTVVSPNRWISVTNNTNDFTGDVVVESGTLYVGNKGSENSGSDAQLGDGNSTYTVKSGATFYTHLGGNSKTFAPNITLEDGAIFGNRDGHVTYNGNITTDGNVSYNFYWNKQNTFSGVVSGTGTLTINGPDNEDGTCEIRLTNANNTFTGTYKLAGKNANRKIKLVACATTGAASYNLTNAYSILAFSGDVTAAALTGAAGTVESSTAGTARTVTLTGNSDVRSLAVSNDITFAVTTGETYITSTTKATVASGATVKVILTADQKLSGLTLENVTVNGGTVVFLDIDGTTELQSSDSNAYEAAQTSTYTVTAEGGSWNKDPETGDAITLAFGDIAERTLDASILPEGVTHLAGMTVTGANASVTATFAAIADAVIIEDALSIVGAEEETTIAGVISGSGKVKIAAGLVKFTNTNTYTGGTDIAADATLVMGNANAIGTTGNITGAGTLKFSGFIPANRSNITVADGDWTGTFYMMNRPSSGTFPVNDWGNANSTVCFENCSGYLTPPGGTTVVPNIRVEGDGWRSQNGNGNAQFTFTGALSGSGKLEVATGTPSAGNFYKFTGDVSKFTGYVNVTNNHRIVFGNAESQGNGKITIATDMTIAANMTWSANNGIAIMDGATLTVNGAITGAIANAGTLIYGVDSTASNTISGAGAIQVAAAKTVDLTSATLTDFTGTYSVGDGATLKLPFAATAEKSIALGTDAKLLVVLNDEQKGSELSVSVTGGSVQFVDANGNVLCNGASYTAPTYTVGKGWTGANLTANANVIIDFAETEGKTVDLAAILGEVTALSKLTVKGSNGGTITNSTVTACPTVEVLAGGRTEVPAALLNLATTVTGPTAEGSLLYVTGETTAITSRYPYTGNRHFETLKFTGAKTIGQGIDTYEVAAGEKIEFHYNDGACYETSLSVNGGEIRTMQNTYVWLAGIANKTFTLKAGTADFSNVTVDDGTKGLLIGYQEETHTFDIQGGELNAPNTSIVAWETDCRFIQSGGTVKTKGFRQRSDNNNRFTVMTLTGGTIELGAGGIPNLSMESISFGGATIHAVADNTIAEALNMTAGATLSAAEVKTMKVTSAITGTATLSIAGAGTVDLSGATIPNTIALNVAAGATAVVAADQLSTFAQVIVPETATLKIKGLTADSLLVGRLNCTLGAESTLDGAIVLDGIEGETTTFTEGVLSVTFTANPTLTGNAWWWDYEFNGDVRSTGSDVAPLVLEGDGTSYVTVDGDNKALYFQKTPYRDNGNDVKARFAEVDTFTAVMYCQPGNHNNVPLVGFGSTTQNDKVAVVLATGAVAADGEMAIMLVKGDNHVVTPLADNLVVPNATKAYHLYAFTFDAQADKTVISVYVDGKLKKTTTVNEHFRVSNGFQIGSIHGGVMTNQTGLSKYPDSGDSGTIDFLRVTKGLLSADAMRALAEAYPYHSENGTATRTVAEATVNWVADDTWLQAMPNADAVQQAAPNNGTNVTLTANVATEVTVNLTEAVTYETVTVVGDDAVTFKKGEAATFKAGDITIGTDVTIEYGAVDVDTLIVNGGKILTFDFTDYDFNSIYASKTLPLTGLATLGENATVTVALPTLPVYLTAECVFDASKSEYALAITVTGTLAATIQDDEITWKVGETVVTPPADLTAVESITMTVVGDNSVTLIEDMTLASVVLTGEGEGNAVTFESGKLTVNNTLTMNNVNVTATPETLIAAVVTGAAGTETFTMHSQASYSHEQAFAMRFERCALTKTGSGTVPIAVNGIELDTVNVTLKNGALQLASRGGDPQIKDTTFTYVDANEDGVADGELTNYGWIHSTTTTTFIVPTGVTGRAVVGSCLTNTGAVVKQGAGTLVLGIMKTNNANPYTGATTIEAGTLVYQVVNNSANPFVMNSEITVEAGAAIKGVENCTLASLSLADGAVVDATAAPVTATAVTLPTGEGAKVVLKKDASGDVLTYTGDVPNMNLFTTATTLENKALGLGVKVNEGVVTLVLTQVSVPEVVIPDDATEDEIAELVQQQAEAEVAAQIVADALAASTDEETRTANVTAIENPGAVSIIENVGVELTQNEGEETYTAKFTYDFGISAIKVVALNLDDVEGTELYVVVKAELDDDYSFADGVTVSVMNGENAVEGAVAVNEAGTESDAPTGNMRYFRFPLPTNRGTHSYRVRASK